MNQEEEKKVEDVKTESTENVEIDYKALAESNAALAEAEKERADAAEALIIKNKKLSKDKRDDEEVDEEEKPLTLKNLKEVLPEILKGVKEDNSPETAALAEANRKLVEAKAKNAEIIRATKAKDGVYNDSANTQRDGLPKVEPKLPENSPLKGYVHIGNGVYTKKLTNGKTLHKNTKAAAGQPKTWVA